MLDRNMQNKSWIISMCLESILNPAIKVQMWSIYGWWVIEFTYTEINFLKNAPDKAAPEYFIIFL